MFKIGNQKELECIIYGYEETTELLRQVSAGTLTAKEAISKCNIYLRDDLISALTISEYL